MLHLAIFLTISYIAYLIYEKKSNDKYLSSFKHIIHVNGIRGKTSVCRLIDANLRGTGYKVFTKTTGSTPIYMDTNGNEHIIKRKGTANIKEQLKIIKLAYKEKAEILILECMAVNPELQKVSQKEIVKGNLNVITNVRYDHIFDMGESLDNIAESLSNTVPENGMLFTCDEKYFEYFSNVCSKNNTEAILCKTDKFIENENYVIAYEIGNFFGISRENFLKNIQCYKEDFGAHKLYELKDNVKFLNLFSVNDPESTLNILNSYIKDTEDIIFIYNHRVDRPDRLLLFSKRFFNSLRYKRILIIGENRSFATRLLRKEGFLNVTELPDWHNIFNVKDSNLIVGIGNIKGSAYELINYLEEDNTNE
jgi:poly-gamma-glutamate synthase PgsB/CapB